jgi:hypothetical protein
MTPTQKAIKRFPKKNAIDFCGNKNTDKHYLITDFLTSGRIGRSARKEYSEIPEKNSLGPMAGFN